MMTLKNKLKKASKKSLRKAIKQLIRVHNEYENQVENQLRNQLRSAIDELRKQQIARDNDMDAIKNEKVIRTDYTSELLHNAYTL